MPYIGLNFLETDPNEIIDYGFDFDSELATAEYLVSATWTIIAVKGDDLDPNGKKVGATTVAIPTGGTKTTLALQRVAGLLENVTYRMICLATTDTGQKFEFYASVKSKASGNE